MARKPKKKGFIAKDKEYALFIKILREGTYGHWLQIARAVGVDIDTIERWRKMPEAQAIMVEEINDALANMKATGKDDWRMWEARLKMLGIAITEKVELSGKDGKDLNFSIILDDRQTHSLANPSLSE